MTVSFNLDLLEMHEVSLQIVCLILYVKNPWVLNGGHFLSIHKTEGEDYTKKEDDEDGRGKEMRINEKNERRNFISFYLLFFDENDDGEYGKGTRIMGRRISKSHVIIFHESN
ncbi:hypothetical protein BT93_I0308 [Corymbia citriodora subsp. variegata]|nr:hypothetical protein BT93_I0308 [Corymbia citriodora subsp. variegata]